MYTAKLMNEFFHGPIWVYGPEGVTLMRFPLVYEDPILSELNEQAADMYADYYEFNSHDSPCWFNYEKEKEEKDIMLDLITRIVARLEEINDGSFVVEDYVSEYLRSL